MPQGEDDTGWRRFWQGWVKPLIIVIAVVSTVRSAIADWNDVPTQSMEPNILVGDRIFVNKLALFIKHGAIGRTFMWLLHVMLRHRTNGAAA